MDKTAVMKFFVCLLLGVSVFLLFSPAAGFDFLGYDDDIYVFKNPHLKGGLTPQALRWAFSADLLFDSMNADYWQPVTFLSRLADIRLWGMDPGGHHLTNILLHIFNALLLFLLFARMTGSLRASAWVAFLFALHPVQVQPVAWITARKDLLSTSFGFLTLASYFCWTKRPRSRTTILTCACFVLSIMSKPVWVTLPLLLLALDYWPLGRLPVPARDALRERVFEKWPFIAISFIACGIFLAGRSGTVSIGMKAFLIADAPFYYFRYLVKALWPLPLAIRYPDFPPISVWQILETWAYILTASFFILKKFARQAPYLVFGWLWFLITLMPSVGLNFEDRYLYVPILGLLVMPAWGLPPLFKKLRIPRSLPALSAIAIVLLCGAVSRRELRHWQDTETVFSHALLATGGNPAAHNVLAACLMDKRDMEGAIDHYTKAIFLKPDFAEAHNNLGFALASQGKYNVAKTHYEIALELDPDFMLAHNNLGVTHAELGNWAEAIAHFKRALELMPHYTDAKFNLAGALLQQRRFAKAQGLYEELLRERPDDPEIYNDLGVSLAAQGRPEEAIAYYSKALSLRPGSGTARKKLKEAKDRRDEALSQNGGPDL